MFAANESEKAKQKEAFDRVESLCASADQKHRNLIEYSNKYKDSASR